MRLLYSRKIRLSTHLKDFFFLPREGFGERADQFVRRTGTGKPDAQFRIPLFPLKIAVFFHLFFKTFHHFVTSPSILRIILDNYCHIC